MCLHRYVLYFNPSLKILLKFVVLCLSLDYICKFFAIMNGSDQKCRDFFSQVITYVLNKIFSNTGMSDKFEMNHSFLY